jgi:hypothetical protein
MTDSMKETTQFQTCGSQVVDDKSLILIADSTMDMARWQTCGSQVVDGKYLMTDSTMANLVIHKLWMTNLRWQIAR